MTIVLDVHQTDHASGNAMSFVASVEMQPEAALALCVSLLVPSMVGAKIVAIEDDKVVIGYEYNMAPSGYTQIMDAIPDHYWWTHTFRLDDWEPGDPMDVTFNRLRWTTVAFARMFRADNSSWFELSQQVIDLITQAEVSTT